MNEHLTEDLIRKVPKVELHEHLDGSVRPSTLIEISKEKNLELPTYDEEELAAWFSRGSREKSLTLYLESFTYTVDAMQDKESLERIAEEEIIDVAADGVVYIEVRFAPALHTHKGLSMTEVVQAVLTGLRNGRRKTGTEFGLILCAMRNELPELSLKVAELAVAFKDQGVVGFDLAGDEAGNPARKHLSAFQFIRNHNFNITIHAGEAFGTESIWQAIQICGAQRIGHGIRITDDMTIKDGKIEKMGSLSEFILDKRIPLENCLTSNVGTGATESFDTHPFPLLYQNSFRVFLSTDNRLMSGTSLTKEMMIAVEHYGFGLKDLEKITLNAMKSAFIHHNDRLRIIYDVIKKGYADIRATDPTL